jgi:hypothetical protein
MNAAHTFRVTCDCAICEQNAEHVGAAFPLAALIRPLAAKNLGVTERNANKASKVHGFVYTAYDPSLASLPTERRFAVPA